MEALRSTSDDDVRVFRRSCAGDRQTASFNIPLVHLLESLGLNRDGVLRAHHELDGRFHDDYVYSLLKDKWPSRQKR
jgi:hypothetical protein